MQTVTISLQQYRDFLKAEYKLQLLEMGGVDNWGHYDDSIRPDDEDIQSYGDYEEEVDDGLHDPA